MERLYPARYRLEEDGKIYRFPTPRAGTKDADDYENKSSGYPYRSLEEVQKVIDDRNLRKQVDSLEKRLTDTTLQENTRNALAAQIQALTAGGGGMQNPNAGPEFNQALAQLSAGRNYGSSDLGAMLNFQVSDQQIIDDYNNSKLSRLNSVIERGNTQIAGIQERLNAANQLLAGLPAGDARRTGSEVFIKQLSDDLKSVTSAVTEAQDMQKNFKPITADSPEALKEVTSFRSFVQLPEERASQQLYQIDPDAYRTSVALGQRYRQMRKHPLAQPLRRRLSNCVRPLKKRPSTSFALDLPLVRKNGVGMSNPFVAHRLQGAISLG
jgi:hypothetical protein